MIEHGFLRTKDGERIAYRHFREKGRNGRVAVIAHGFFNCKDSFLLTGLAGEIFSFMDVFAFDFRGHGESSGLYTWTSREHQDLIAVLDHLRGAYGKIEIVSFSLGASVSINVLSRGNFGVESMVCVSAVCDLRRIDWRPWKIDWENDVMYAFCSAEGRKGKGARIGPWWLEKPVPLESVSGTRVPVHYIHGDSDPVVGPGHSAALMERTPAGGELSIIEGGPHAEYLLRKSPGVKDLILGHLNR
ncbi:MAG: alpha/beta fold hydrolase [Candidatus Omnitrophica bacterium]|nr:alpha/beta fold hydrolase [Candidatus Omnitrophota bacterium]